METRDINVRSVPVDLWRRAKAQAAIEGKALNEWLSEAVREKLDKAAGVTA